MHYFITGTAGFIGFHLARRLLQDGHRVTGFVGLTPYYNVKLKHMRHAALAQFPSFTPAIAMHSSAMRSIGLTPPGRCTFIKD